MTTIGRFLLDNIISDDEFERISRLLNEDKGLCDSLIKCAGKSQLCAKISKHEKVDGFRPGTSQHQNEAIKKVYSSLKSGSKHERHWKIYKYSVAELIGDTFNDLLGNNEIGSSEETVDIFKLICQKSHKFKINKEEIKELYRIFPIDRMDDEALIPEYCDNPDPVVLLQNRIEEHISQSKIWLVELKKEIVDIVNEKHHSFNVEKKVADCLKKYDFENCISAIEVKIDANINDIGGIQSELEGHNKSFNEIISNQNQCDFNGKLEDVNTRLNSMKESIKNFTNKLSTSEEKQIGHSQQLIIDLHKKISEEYRELIKVNIERVSDRVKGNDDYVSSLINKNTILMPPKDLIENEEAFISIFYHRLLSLDPAYTYVSACMYHSLLKSSQSIVCENVEVVLAWLDSLGWLGNVVNMSASPAWHSENSWKFGARHLFETSSGIPKILFLYDYDVGFVEGYLLSTMRLWRVNHFLPFHSKIFLIPTGESKLVSSPRLLESSILLSEEIVRSIKNDNCHLNDYWSSREEGVSKFHREENTGVSVKKYTSWCDSGITSMENNVDAESYIKIGQSFGIEMNLSVVDRYQRIKCNLSNFLNKNDPHCYAYSASLYEWLVLKYDEVKADEFEAQLKSLSMI